MTIYYLKLLAASFFVRMCSSNAEISLFHLMGNQILFEPVKYVTKNSESR